MIRLTKTDKPDILTKNAAAWTRELLDGIAAKRDPKEIWKNRYNHPQIKAALIEETSGKCAYCESKLLHVTYGDIEHIIAKKVKPDFTYEWDNLTLACDICNTNKGKREGLIDPYTDKIDTYLRFRGPMLNALPGSEVGRATVVLLDLNRPPLMEMRREKIDELNLRLEEILKTKDDNARQCRRLSTMHETPKESFQHARPGILKF
jgi:hypothetical protein